MRKSLTTLLAVGCLSALLAGCGSSGNNAQATSSQGNAKNSTASTSGKPVEGGNIVLDATQDLKDLDPALCYDTQSSEVVWQLYDQLVTYKDSTTQIVPMVAKSWDISKDGKTYTFHLRDGVKFWNGKSVTSQSFVDEFQRVLSKQVASPGEWMVDPVIQGSTAYFNGTAKTVTGISAPDKHTLVIKLTKPTPFFLEILTMPFFSAVDNSFIDQVGAKVFDSSKAMGSGPFELQSISADQIVMKKNPNYWLKDQYGQKLPYLDKITFNISRNQELDSMNFESGKTAFIGWAFGGLGIPTTSYPHFKTDPTLSKLLMDEPLNAVQYLGMNTSMAPFNNPKVRLAVEYAIDKQHILKLINGRGMVANQPLAPNIPGYVKDLPSDVQYSYNPQKAQQLLKQAGIPQGYTVTLYSQNDPDQIKLDTAVQADLKKVGLNVQVKTLARSTNLNLQEQGKEQLYWAKWLQDYPDASDFMMLFQTNQAPVNNSTLYSNKSVDAVLAKALTDTNAAERNSLYRQATIQVLKDAPWVPMFYDKVTYAAQSWVHGFYISPTMMDPLQKIWIDPGHSAQ